MTAQEPAQQSLGQQQHIDFVLRAAAVRVHVIAGHDGELAGLEHARDAVDDGLGPTCAHEQKFGRPVKVSAAVVPEIVVEKEIVGVVRLALVAVLVFRAFLHRIQSFWSTTSG